MYDAVLISTHYNYGSDGTMIPAQNDEDYFDLSHVIPLGIIHIAQYLHDCGFKVRVLHIPHEMYFIRSCGVGEDELKNYIEKILGKYPAHVCGIQAHWHLYSGGSLFISNLYKKLFPDSLVFLGGYMATAMWKEFLGISRDIDGIVLGEGEKTFKNILETVLTSKDCKLSDVNGIAYKTGDDDYIYNPPIRDSLLSLDEIPIIYPDSPPFENLIWPKGHYINISRGLCPEKCAYCVANNKEINTRAYQTLKIDKILEQIHVYQENGLQQLFLGEHHFLNISFMTELFEGIIRENFNLYFILETHPVIFENKTLLDKMIQAHFWRFTMGCESGSDSLLKRMGRNSSSRQIIESVKRIAESGGIVLTSWISNLPGETDSEFLETQEIMRQVVKAGGFIYWIENLHVSPGSQLFENPQYWDIQILLNKLEDWIEWSMNSKKYVSFEEARKKPLKYLTHLSRDVTPEEMIKRFYSNRKLALRLIPEMRHNLKYRFKNLSSSNFKIEMRSLNWYENGGWKLWLY